MVKVSQKYIDSLLTYFHLPTWAVYLCSGAFEQPLQMMVCCISAFSYDRCAIHRNFPMTCPMNCCSMCFLNVLILHPKYSVELISLSFSRPDKHDALRPWQVVQGDRMSGTLIFACCTHKPDFRHNLCM